LFGNTSTNTETNIFYYNGAYSFSTYNPSTGYLPDPSGWGIPGNFTVSPVAVLTVVKSASPSPSVTPGQVVTYTVVITNTNNGTANSVVATDSVPTYTTYVANSTRLNGITVAGDGSTFPLIAGLLVDNNGSRSAGVAATGVLPAGASATVTFQMTVK
jgi:uncharacterized repeat protein (TIGR01451 family)